MGVSEPNSRLTILVVDDSPVERHLIKAIFLQRGHRVLEATNGAEALLTLSSESADVVVSDGVMPILDGYQLCRLLKEDPSTRHIPVILLTGRASGLSRFWARTCGADRFLLKGRDAIRVVEVALELMEQGGVPPSVKNTQPNLQELGIDAIHRRLSKALERQLAESAMRDIIANLYSAQRPASDMAMTVLDLLHELVLPGAIHLVIQAEDGPVGLGLHGESVGSEELSRIVEASRQALGQKTPWPSVWKESLPLTEGALELHDPVIFTLPVRPSGNLISTSHALPKQSPDSASAWMTLYMERKNFQEYERLFEVACHELGRLLELAQNRRQLLHAEEALVKALAAVQKNTDEHDQ